MRGRPWPSGAPAGGTELRAREAKNRQRNVQAERLTKVKRGAALTDEVPLLQVEPVQVVECLLGLRARSRNLSSADRMRDWGATPPGVGQRRQAGTHVCDLLVDDEGSSSCFGTVAEADLADGAVLAEEVVQVLACESERVRAAESAQGAGWRGIGRTEPWRAEAAVRSRLEAKAK